MSITYGEGALFQNLFENFHFTFRDIYIYRRQGEFPITVPDSVIAYGQQFWISYLRLYHNVMHV